MMDLMPSIDDLPAIAPEEAFALFTSMATVQRLRSVVGERRGRDTGFNPVIGPPRSTAAQTPGMGSVCETG